jgi:hypothetical protein
MLQFIGGTNEKGFNNICFYLLVSRYWIFWIGSRHVCRWLRSRKTSHPSHCYFDFYFTYIYFHQAIEKDIQLIHNKT